MDAFGMKAFLISIQFLSHINMQFVKDNTMKVGTEMSKYEIHKRRCGDVSDDVNFCSVEEHGLQLRRDGLDERSDQTKHIMYQMKLRLYLLLMAE